MLPATFRQYAEATWATLPELEDMPPVPPELSERIHGLRAQIVALQAEIKSEMTQWRAECASSASAVGGLDRRPSRTYVDRSRRDRPAVKPPRSQLKTRAERAD